MTLSKGNLILAEYTARLKDVDEVIETTYEEEAKRVGAHDPTRKYEPRLIAVGDGWVLKGLDEALQASSVGKKFNVDVSPEKGFGTRDPNKVRLIPLRKFGDKANELRIGDSIEVDNREGIVRFVGSGRAQIDFNHRYAGKTLNYDVQITKQLNTSVEKVKALVRRRIPIEENKLRMELSGGSAKIDLPEDFYTLEGLQVLKRAISNDVFKYVGQLDKVLFTEVYLSAKSKEEAKAGQGAKSKQTKKPGSQKKEGRKSGLAGPKSRGGTESHPKNRKR